MFKINQHVEFLTTHKTCVNKLDICSLKLFFSFIFLRYFHCTYTYICMYPRIHNVCKSNIFNNIDRFMENQGEYIYCRLISY